MVDYVRQLPGHEAGLERGSPTGARLRLDLPLLGLLLALTGYGLVVLYSAADGDMGAVMRQARYFVLGFLVMLVAAQFPLVRYQRWSPWVYLGGLLLLFGVIFFGVGAKGAQRWLDLGGFRFQPAEIMKLAVPMIVAWYLHPRVLPPSLGAVTVAFVLLVTPEGTRKRVKRWKTGFRIGGGQSPTRSYLARHHDAGYGWLRGLSPP